MERQGDADSLFVNHLPEVTRRATRIRTVRQKKSGLAGLFGGKKTIQVLPSAKELHQFSDSLIALQQRQEAEMDAYADSLRNRNRMLNAELERLIHELDIQAQNAFAQRERKITEAQALSVRLFTAAISTAIVLLFLSYLAIQREMKRNDYERKQREKLIGELQVSNEANEKLIKLRRDLIQNVTYELRTPLTAISGNAELMLNDTEADSRNPAGFAPEIPRAEPIRPDWCRPSLGQVQSCRRSTKKGSDNRNPAGFVLSEPRMDEIRAD